MVMDNSFAQSLIRNGNGKDLKSLMEELCSHLRKENDRYNWVGIYVLKDQNLELFAYSGEETEHKKIKLGEGLCSLAIVRNETVNVHNVKETPEYLACFPSTKSELVVPIRLNGKAIGEIDIDSDTQGAFSIKDEVEMEKLAETISESIGKVIQH